MSKPFKPWSKKGNKSKDFSPLSTVEPSNEKHDTPSKNKKNNNNSNSKNDQLKQSSISKFFASPARGSKRPLAEEDEEEEKRPPNKRIDDKAENALKTKEQLAKFQFDFSQNGGDESSMENSVVGVVKEKGGTKSTDDTNETNSKLISNERPKTDKGNSNDDDKTTKSASNWLPSAKVESKGVASKGKSTSSYSGGKVKYTPLEQQFVDLKKQYPDAVLLIECGYKFR